MKETAEKLKGNVLSTEKKDSRATVQAEVTAVDMNRLYALYQAKAASLILDTVKKDTQKREELASYLKELVTGSRTPIKTEKLTIRLTKKDGKWKIVSDAPFLDAISSGYYSAVLN